MVDYPSPVPDKTALRQQEIESQLAALHSPMTGARVAAVRRLGDLQAGLDHLLAALIDQHEAVRSAVAQSLGNFTNSSRASEIIEYLLAAIDDPSEKVCQAAIRSLGTLHAEIARPEIEEFLNDPNPFISGSAILALARLGAADLSAQIAAFVSSENHYIRIQAARAVGILKYASAGPEIIRLLQATRQERLSGEQTTLQSRLDWREDDLYNLQNQLVRTAGELRLPEAVPILIEIAQKDIGLRGLAVESLIAIGAEVAPELLANLLSDPSVYLRKRLLTLMIQQNYRQAIPLIRPLLRVENASTRSAALQAVTEMKDTQSLGEITWMCYHDSNPFVRVQAVQSLVTLAEQEAKPHLVSLAGDANFQVRKTAIAQLIRWEPPDGLMLTQLAHFSIEFPDDDLVPSIVAILANHNFDPLSAAAAPLEPPSLIPADFQLEIPNLRLLLERWRFLLRKADDPASIAETQKIEEALSYLLSILSEGKNQA